MDKPPNRIAERAERKPRARLNEKSPNPLSFSCKIGLLFWSGHSNRVSGIFFVIMRGIHSWKLPNVAPASLLTAASEGLSQTAGGNPALSCLSSVCLLHTTPNDTIAWNAWPLCAHQHWVLRRHEVDAPRCGGLPLLPAYCQGVA